MNARCDVRKGRRAKVVPLDRVGGVLDRDGQKEATGSVPGSMTAHLGGLWDGLAEDLDLWACRSDNAPDGVLLGPHGKTYFDVTVGGVECD